MLLIDVTVRQAIRDRSAKAGAAMSTTAARRQSAFVQPRRSVGELSRDANVTRTVQRPTETRVRRPAGTRPLAKPDGVRGERSPLRVGRLRRGLAPHSSPAPDKPTHPACSRAAVFRRRKVRTEPLTSLERFCCSDPRLSRAASVESARFPLLARSTFLSKTRRHSRCRADFAG